MEYRLWYYITWPSAILATIFEFYLVYAFNFWLEGWMITKLAFVIGLWGYHLANQKLMNQAQKTEISQSSQKLRLWNEVATLFLFAIVFLVVLKSQLSTLWSLVSLFALMGLLFLAIKWYKKKRKK